MPGTTLFNDNPHTTIIVLFSNHNIYSHSRQLQHNINRWKIIFFLISSCELTINLSEHNIQCSCKHKHPYTLIKTKVIHTQCHDTNFILNNWQLFTLLTIFVQLYQNINIHISMSSSIPHPCFSLLHHNQVHKKLD